ncbi:MAG: hypothetical protein GWN84_08775 [Gammaproteobacteria bacterium]|nr:hypothetical protein [Gammaproteobacteria bacterium]NIR82990.1 hypothetical protein [Gammaproteobacteria bacterium]NIU04132.1 hypothetical protein [Gammaproteobacteria bacterium]NIX85406.1 hypothetical protein [Gammaproteobacteria bacterium]
MRNPDFGLTGLEALEQRDLKFLIDNFPAPGRSYEEIAELIHTLPSTVESMLSSDYVFERLFDRRELLLDISPFLLFSVLLRRTAPETPTGHERRVFNYLANLLSLFVRTERLYRPHPGLDATYEYLTDMIAEAENASTREQFMIYSHIGNYALYLTGLFADWIDHHHRYRRRLVDREFYVEFGQTYFERAASHPLAREYGLDAVFLRLAIMFGHYRDLLDRVARRYLFPA